MKKFIILALLIIPSILLAKHSNAEYRARSKKYIEKATGMVNISERDSLLAYTARAQKLGEQSGDIELNRDIHYEIAKLYTKIGMLDSALILLNKTMDLNQILRDSAGIGQVKNQLGNLARFNTKGLVAQQYYSDAIGILETHGSKRELGKAMNNLGFLYTTWGNYDQAIDLFLDALDCYMDSGYDEGVAWLQFSMSQLYKKVGEYQQSLNYIKKSRRIYEKMAAENGDSSGVRIVYAQLGFLYTHHFDSLEKALDYQLKSLRLAEKLGVKAVEADGNNGVGQVYYKMRDYGLAQKYIQKALDLRYESGIFSGIPNNLLYLGKIEQSMENHEQAKDYFYKSIAMAKRTKNRAVESDVYKALADLYFKKSNYRKSFFYLEKHTALGDSILSNEISKKVASTQLQYEIDEKNQENEFLARQNRLQKLQIGRDRLVQVFLGISIIIATLIIIFTIFLYYKQKQIKTLRGLVPICAACKKIRNDQGYYEQVEKYVTEHTEANFSHGICPDCMKKEYPELYEKMKEQGKIAEDQNLLS